MTLSSHQYEFAKDLTKLFIFIESLGLKYTLGELYRTLYQQLRYLELGLSKTKNSMHRKKCACDINLFVAGKVVYDRNDYYLSIIGSYWESLHVLNRWGGNFKSLNDGGHFERYVK